MEKKNTEIGVEAENLGFKILVVDDQEEILDLIKISLKRELDRLNVETSKSAESALKKLEEKDYDVVISDYKMPGMNGLELLEATKERNYETKFIILTGKGDESVAAEAVNIGADGYIQKEANFREQVEELAKFILKTAKEGGARKKDKRLLKTLEEAYNIGESVSREDILGEGFEDIRDFFSILSKEGTFKILKAVEGELRSERKRWEEFDLSKRQYYSRLRSLKNSDIIKKKGENYILTKFGRKATNLLLGLGSLINGVVNKEEGGSQNLLEKIGKTEGIGSSIEESTSQEFEMPDIRMQNAVNYEGFVEQIIEMIEQAEEELYIAISFADQRILRALIQMEKSDIDLKVLMTQKAIEDAKGISEKLLSESETEKLREVFEKMARSCRDFPFSFAIRNSQKLCVEVKNPLYTSHFFLGFVLEGEEVWESFHGLFENLYKGAKERPQELIP